MKNRQTNLVGQVRRKLDLLVFQIPLFRKSSLYATLIRAGKNGHILGGIIFNTKFFVEILIFWKFFVLKIFRVKKCVEKISC